MDGYELDSFDEMDLDPSHRPPDFEEERWLAEVLRLPPRENRRPRVFESPGRQRDAGRASLASRTNLPGAA